MNFTNATLDFSKRARQERPPAIIRLGMPTLSCPVCYEGLPNRLAQCISHPAQLLAMTSMSDLLTDPWPSPDIVRDGVDVRAAVAIVIGDFDGRPHLLYIKRREREG